MIMDKDKYIKSILSEVDKTITGRDAMNLIAAMDNEVHIHLFNNYGEEIEYILKIEYSPSSVNFMVVLNVYKGDSCLLKNIVLGFSPWKHFADKIYNAWKDEISNHITTRFFCQDTCEFYEFSLNS